MEAPLGVSAEETLCAFILSNKDGHGLNVTVYHNETCRASGSKQAGCVCGCETSIR